MDDIDWGVELAARDIMGGLTDANRDLAKAKAEDAAARIADEYPVAWERAKANAHTRRSIISIVASAVFRILRDASNDGYTREADGVYSYQIGVNSQSPDVYFTAQDREYLSSKNNVAGVFAFGSLTRGGVSSFASRTAF